MALLNFKGYLSKNKKAKIIKEFDSSEHEALARFENLKKRLYIKDRPSIARESLEPMCKDIMARSSFSRISLNNSISKLENFNIFDSFNNQEYYCTQDDSAVDLQNKTIPDSNLLRRESIKEMIDISSKVLKDKRESIQKNNKMFDPMIEQKNSNKLLTEIKEINDKDLFSLAQIQDFLKLKVKKFKEMPKNPVKIGEATFSEVYRIGGLVYKIIAFNEFYDIESFCKEIFVLETLKNCKGISEMTDRFIVKGKYTSEYIAEWKNFKLNKYSESVCPSVYKCQQKFGVIVMKDCGLDLENTIFTTFFEICNFLDQLFTTVAKLEILYRFEHRDLHWGNIMVKDGEVNLIDFNLTRLEAILQNGVIYDLNYKSGVPKTLYTNLNKETWLFEGDENVDFQFDIYKKMKQCCDGDWVSFNVKSNLLWIIYIFDKLWFKIKTFQNNEDKIKSTKLIQYLLEFSKECKNTEDLKFGFRKYLGKNK